MFDQVDTIEELIEIAAGWPSAVTPTRVTVAGLTIEHEGRAYKVARVGGGGSQMWSREPVSMIRVGMEDGAGRLIRVADVELLRGEDDPEVLRQAIDQALAEAKAAGWGTMLTDAQRDLRESEAVVTAVRARRDDAVRGAVGAGWSQYRVAQVLGITPQAVAKIIG